MDTVTKSIVKWVNWVNWGGLNWTQIQPKAKYQIYLSFASLLVFGRL